MNRIQRKLAVLMLVPLLGSACSSGHSVAPGHIEVVSLVRAGRFEKALSAAQDNFERIPESEVAIRDLRDARMAYLMSAGRELTFQDRTEEGLELFYQAHALDESNEVVRDWINKARIQLAEDALTMSGTLTSRDELAERREVLRRVLRYLPENEGSQRVANLRLLASSSLERVEENLAYCEARGKESFEDGLGSLSQARYHESWHDFSTAVLFDKTQEEAITRLQRVGVLQGEELLEEALELERMGLFDAARMGFERVHQKDPISQQAIDGLNRLEREVRVDRILQEAEMAMLRGTWDEAEVLLDEAKELTLVQMDLVDGMRLKIRNARWEKLYQRALALESEGSLPMALKVFDGLLESAEEYKEASAHREFIIEFIAKAEELYARAAEAGNEADEYALLREIQVLWPAYLDVGDRIQILGARLQKAKGDEADSDAKMDVESSESRPSDRKANDSSMGEGR